MSTITELLDRLSGIAVLKERQAETNRNVDRTLTWLLDHEKRLLRLELGGGRSAGRPALERP
jgi:hypothetical protein